MEQEHSETEKKNPLSKDFLNAAFDTLVDQTRASLEEFGVTNLYQAGENLKRYRRLLQESPERKAEFLKAFNNDELYDMRMMNTFCSMQSNLNSMEMNEKARLEKFYANSTANMTAEERTKYIPEEIRNRYEPLNQATREFGRNKPMDEMTAGQGKRNRYEDLKKRDFAERYQDVMNIMNSEREQLLRERFMPRLRENMAAKPENRLSPNELLTSIAHEVDDILDAPHAQARARVQDAAMARLREDFMAAGKNELSNSTLVGNVENIKHMLKSGGKELPAGNEDLALNKLSDRYQDNPPKYNDNAPDS